MEILPNGYAVVGGGDCLSAEMGIPGRGPWSDGLLHQILPRIKSGWWVVDGGAAMGDHTGAYIHRVGPTGKVLAFEPNPQFFECLEKNCPTAQLSRTALWHDREVFFLHSPPENIGAGYLSKDKEPHAPNDVVSVVETTILDDLSLPRLDYMKLDVEGSEYFALLGSIMTINRCRPLMVLEINPGPMGRLGVTHDMLWDLLESLKYDWSSIRNDPGKRCTSCDIFAWPL